MITPIAPCLFYKHVSFVKHGTRSLGDPESVFVNLTIYLIPSPSRVRTQISVSLSMDLQGAREHPDHPVEEELRPVEDEVQPTEYDYVQAVQYVDQEVSEYGNFLSSAKGHTGKCRVTPCYRKNRRTRSWKTERE